MPFLRIDKGHKALIAACAVFALMLGATAPPAKQAPARPLRRGHARTAVARRGVLEKTLRVTGITAASRLRYVFAPRMRGTRGRDANEFTLELETLAPSGRQVRKGDLLASLDRQFMISRLDDYRSSVEQQKATLDRLRANLSIRREQQRQRIRAIRGEVEKSALDLQTAPVRSAIQVERYRMNLEEAAARYNQTLKEGPLVVESESALIRRYEIEVEWAERELAAAERNLESMEMRAPMDGLFVRGHEYRGDAYQEFEPGGAVSPGRSFAAVVDPASMVVDAAVNQVDVEPLRAGQPARIRFESAPGLELPGHVVAVAAFPSRGGYRPQWVRNLPVRLAIDGSDARVGPNLSASAEIVLERSEDAVIVPRECVFQEPDGHPVAWVDQGERWEKRELTLGLESNVEVEVRSGVGENEELAAGERP